MPGDENVAPNTDRSTSEEDYVTTKRKQRAKCTFLVKASLKGLPDNVEHAVLTCQPAKANSNTVLSSDVLRVRHGITGMDRPFQVSPPQALLIAAITCHHLAVLRGSRDSGEHHFFREILPVQALCYRPLPIFGPGPSVRSG